MRHWDPACSSTVSKQSCGQTHWSSVPGHTGHSRTYMLSARFWSFLEISISLQRSPNELLCLRHGLAGLALLYTLSFQFHTISWLRSATNLFGCLEPWFTPRVDRPQWTVTQSNIFQIFLFGELLLCPARSTSGCLAHHHYTLCQQGL
jgi:hypothetical protein